MTGIRRALVLVGLTLAVMIGAAIPASATFTNSVSVATTVKAATVSAPGAPSTVGTSCPWIPNGYGGYVQVLRVKLSWTAGSTTSPRGITGYSVTAVLPDGTKVPVGPVGTGTSIVEDFPVQYASYGIRAIVTTTTSFGWFADSTRSAVVTC